MDSSSTPTPPRQTSSATTRLQRRRITLTATLASAKLSLHIDVNIGDPIWPTPRTVHLPKPLGGTITLAGYPLSMVYAEKITTALQGGTVNARWRDFADICILTGRHATEETELQRALAEVAAHRHVELSPLADALDGYATLGQARWAAWRRRQHLDDRLPSSFAKVLNEVIAFADPALQTDAGTHEWDPH